MVGPKEDQILKFWEEHGIGKAIKDIRNRQTATVECFLVEMLRHPSFANCRPDDIELEITTGMKEAYTITVSYRIKLRGQSR